MTDELIKFLERDMGIKEDRVKLDLSSLQDSAINNILEGLRFFPPSSMLTKEILRLNQELGGSYFEGQYEKLEEEEQDAGIDYLDEAMQDKNWFRRIFSQVSDIIFHERERYGDVLSDQEEFAFFEKFISERVYNHLAMLSRSPHARRGGAFSICEELTKEMAEKLGLGLYLDETLDCKLRVETQNTLLDLAYEFQRWLTEVAGGRYPTVWGGICIPEKAREFSGRSPRPLVLIPDAQKNLKEQGAALIAAG